MDMDVPKPRPCMAAVAYLTDPTYAHIQGVGVAASSIQHFGCQLHHQALSPSMTLERAWGSRVIVQWNPFIIAALVLHVIVG